MSASDPQKLGEFEILEKLGHGGMGAVYKARQSSLGRFVALKVLPGNMANDEEFITRFKAEARSAASLNHPGIVQVYAAGEDGGVHYFAMEYVDGESLHGRLERKGRIAPLEALAICAHVATALNHGWKRAQIIHRDIKPDNIFLSSDGEVKLGDLGLAKSLGDGSNLTQTGASLGTPYYVSPEQANGESTVDFRADIYSLGCTLFHLLSGKTPYTASSAMAVMIKHITQPPPDIFAAWPECPSAIGPLLSRMLAKNPAERPQSYDALIREMMEVHQEIKDAKPGQKTTRKMPATDSFPPAQPAESDARAPMAIPKKPLPLPVIAALGASTVLLTLLLLWAPWKKTANSLSPVGAAPDAQPTASFPPAAASSVEPDFVPIFNGSDLAGWEGNLKHWSVANGAIVGSGTRGNPVEENTSLIWQGGPVDDFTLRLSYRITAGLSGVLYRSRVIDASRWILGGYQAELHGGMPQLSGALQEERGSRGLMADVGDHAKWKAIGTKHLLARMDDRPTYRPGEWNELEIVTRDDRMIHRINGVVAIDVTDEDPARQARSGLLALRLAKGADVDVQFKNVRLRKGPGAEMPTAAPKSVASLTPVPTPPVISTPVPTTPRPTPIPPTPVPASSPSTPRPAPFDPDSSSAFASLSSRLNPGGGIIFEGTKGPGLGKHIVLLAGDEEYRSEEMLPQLAKILAGYHGFKCTVLFSTNPQTGEIDPNELRNMPGMEALASADLCVLMLRFRNWPDAQMKAFTDYYLAGKPFIALRTSTHAFNGLPPSSPYAAFNHNSTTQWPGGFGRQVFGESWTSHWGKHKAQGTRAVPVEPAASKDPILRSVRTFIGSTDVYEAAPPADAKILMRGQVLSGMTEMGGAATGRKRRLNGTEQDLNDPMMPIVWTREVRNNLGKTNRVFTCTMGTAAEFQELNFRRLLVNACYWTLGFEIPENNKAAIVGEYRAGDYGFNGYVKGVKPADLLLPGSVDSSPATSGPRPASGGTPPPRGQKISLFDSTGTSAWVRNDGQAADWPMTNGALEVGTESLATRDRFQDFKFHVEFWIPRYPSTVMGQARGNSGVYLQNRYELQILDSPGPNPSKTDCGALYNLRAPSRNASTDPETWQSFDVTFQAARFDNAKRKISNARITVIHNGITIHDNVDIPSPTGTGSPEGPEPGPIVMQSHSSKGVRFRNIWVIPQ